MTQALLQTGFASYKRTLCLLNPNQKPPFPQHFPVTSAINSARPGLQSNSQRLGVIPLVLF